MSNVQFNHRNRPFVNPASKINKMFQETLNQIYPNAVAEAAFIEESYTWLNRLGFTMENTLACVGRCRDEVTNTLLYLVRAKWGEAFDFASLGGLFFAGKTGLGAAIAHAPTIYGRPRYLFLLMPHIGITQAGEIGKMLRPGQEKNTTACGALVAFQHEIASGSLDLTMDKIDIEQSLLKNRLANRLGEGVPDLKDLTELARQTALNDLEAAIKQVVDPTTADYAVLTGVQIHGPYGENFISPGRCFAVIEEKIIADHP